MIAVSRDAGRQTGQNLLILIKSSIRSQSSDTGGYGLQNLNADISELKQAYFVKQQ